MDFCLSVGLRGNKKASNNIITFHFGNAKYNLPRIVTLQKKYKRNVCMQMAVL